MLRRNRFLLVAALVVSVAMWGCGGTTTPAPDQKSSSQTEQTSKAPAGEPTKSPGEKTKLVVGSIGWVVDGIKLQELIADYTKIHPEVEIELQPLPEEWQTASNLVKKIQMEAAQGTSSKDVILGMYGWSEVAPLVTLDLLEPLNDLLPKSAIEDVYPNFWAEAKLGDKLYLYPLTTDVVGWIYRPSMLKEAGFAKPPATWDEVLQYADKIKAQYGDKVYALGYDWKTPHRSYLPILATLSDKPFDGDVLDTSSPAARKTLELMVAMHKHMPASSADNLGSAKAFQTGNLAMMMYWPTQIVRAQQAGLAKEDVVYGELPKGERSATVAWTAGSMIPKLAKNKKEAIRFITEGLRTEKADRYNMENWKLVPYKSANERLKASAPDWYGPVIEQAKDALTIPLTPYYNSIIYTVYREEIEKLLLGRQSVDDTMKGMTTRIKQELDKVKK